MTQLWIKARADTRPEQVADTVIHMIGVIGALLAVPVLVTLAAVWRDDGAFIAAVAIYGASLLAMLFFSASYNLTFIRWPRAGVLDLLRRLDHGAIYVKIAGTYTPYAVIAGGPLG
ncbi:MAG: hemolysin III family protein, partial [Pseudomonadota bacterium]